LGWFDIGPKRKENGIVDQIRIHVFNDVKVPKENRIGEDGFGFALLMILNGGRIGIASQALGIRYRSINC
jgi:hypothetical protein